jgi:hypothetical protein
MDHYRQRVVRRYWTMNKRGLLMVYLFVFTLIAVSLGFYLAVTKEGRSLNANVGVPASILMREREFIYEDLYFKNEILERERLKEVIFNSLSEFLDNGGFDIGERESVDGYTVWYRKGADSGCWVQNEEKIIKSYLETLKRGVLNEDVLYGVVDGVGVEREANEYYAIFYLWNSANISYGGFEIYSKGNLGKRIKVDYNFQDFIVKVENIKSIFNECGDNEACWNDRKKGLSWFKDLKVKGKLYKFELVTETLNGDKMIIKGAVDFNEGDLKC